MPAHDERYTAQILDPQPDETLEALIQRGMLLAMAMQRPCAVRFEDVQIEVEPETSGLEAMIRYEAARRARNDLVASLGGVQSAIESMTRDDHEKSIRQQIADDVEARAADVGINSTVLDPEGATGGTQDTALILGALRDAAAVIERVIDLGMDPNGGKHTRILRDLRAADQRVVDRIRRNPEVDAGTCSQCGQRVQRVRRNGDLKTHYVEAASGRAFCSGSGAKA